MIFGTDGIRGRVGDAPLNAATIEKLSDVLGRVLPAQGTVVLGRDTRESCDLLQGWILSRLGARTVVDLGVVPTPVVAFETRARGAQLGIMLTASHNPAGDNGLKFFGSDGLKLPYDEALRWSALAEDGLPAGLACPATPTTDTATHYRRFVLKHFAPEDFKGLRVVFDLAHGAGTYLVPSLLNDLGITADCLGAAPDGRNINDRVGALHPEALAAQVVADRADVGFALDGDGDRLVVVAPEPVHGDLVLYALFLNLKAEGHAPTAVVGTIMCGMGLETALAAHGATLRRRAVGDQNVLADMVAHDLLVGGEPSGHLIQADLFPAGDGFLAALRLARALVRDPALLTRAAAEVPQYPTFEKAIRVARKPPLDSLPAVTAALAALDGLLGKTGRHIVRYSGTEPKLRLYVEAPDLAPLQGAIAALEAAVAEDLG